ncbi:peptidoglycan-associated lipoprotein Pal [Azospira sp. I09]|jgi:peptidoglycan-associated lipoprotein|uniref:peptidoglycan-associated lipoprotein Pal n=1 Tax=Azospira sp. I09 TaxID=1765049 RepID=UPI0012610D45|nr:peptidoglycan-associated lipoprotein Pal [Azospira sp. I09]BBN89041.1 peptidoglycan-associated lipoprotein [Azospira sp. I09]
MRKLALPALIASLFVLAGCGSQPAAPEQSGAGVENRSATATGVGGGDVGMKPYNDPKNVLYKRSVYFDYDKFDIKPEYKELVAAHAKYLAANKGTKILIQGNTDERGSREYNLALGQKRSDAVKKALSLLGVREDQLESVSLGEEKPKAEGNDEAAYAENRRADILYSGEF